MSLLLLGGIETLFVVFGWYSGRGTIVAFILLIALLATLRQGDKSEY